MTEHWPRAFNYKTHWAKKSFTTATIYLVFVSLVCWTKQWDFLISLVTFSWRHSSSNPVECYTSGCISSSCRTAWGKMKKIHRLWRSLRKRSEESKLEKADAFWELELNVSFQQANKGSVNDQVLWLAQGFTSVSSEVKKDVFKVREYFLAYSLVQSSYSRSVFVFTCSSTSLSHKWICHSNLTCCT